MATATTTQQGAQVAERQAKPAQYYLDRVVRFGERGSNVADVRTMGGGFGLTKACMLAQRLGGRAWIASRENVGTRVTLEIPRPRH